MLDRRVGLVVICSVAVLSLPPLYADDLGGADDIVGAEGSGSSIGEDSVGDGVRVDLPAELIGTYEFVSVSLRKETITTVNQLVNGAMVRAAGSLSLDEHGAYTRLLRLFQHDVVVETEEEKGTWSVTTPGVLTLIEDGGDSSSASYMLELGVLTMTPTTGGGPTFDVDELVLRRRD